MTDFHSKLWSQKSESILVRRQVLGCRFPDHRGYSNADAEARSLRARDRTLVNWLIYLRGFCGHNGNFPVT